MSTWDDAKFNRRYKKFYKILVICAVGFFIFCFFGFWITEYKHKKEVHSWEFNGVVNNLYSPGHNVVYVTVSNREYSLENYKTWSTPNESSHKGDNTTNFDFDSDIGNGDTIVKLKNHWDIKLIKKNGKTIILRCDYNN
ncbi:MAG: hypothetical protein ACXVB0_01530 [Mucilaginibacter sp.]